MKKLNLLIVTTLKTVAVCYGQFLGCNGQPPDQWSFDGGTTPVAYLLNIDTFSNSNNIWQVGSPHKITINSSNSAPNVIVTDTINTYPTNDTSVFVFNHPADEGYYFGAACNLAGYYNVNTDSLNDYGTMEISFNQGTTWIDIISDPTYSSYVNWNSSKPTLTGNSNGWQYFQASLGYLASMFNINPGDTILIKFTFISDAIADNLDGLAYDNFQFCDYIEGIEEIRNDNLIEIYPNPTSDLLYIKRKTQSEKETVQVFNYFGQLLLDEKKFKGNIDTKKLNLFDGFYFLKYSDTKNYTFKKFIVEQN